MSRGNIRSTEKTSSPAGRFIGSAVALGLVGLGVYLRSTLQPAPVAEAGGDIEWPRTGCRIELAEVDVQAARSDPFTPRVEFTYRKDGLDRRSTTYAREPRSYDDYTKAWLKLRGLKPGADAFCHVNPLNPGEAVIDPSTPGRTALSFVPFAIMGIGALILFAIWRPRRPASTEQAQAPGCALLFPLVFIGVGGAMFWFMTIPALRQLVSVPSWVETPCTILFSEVRESSGDDGPTYRADIFYEYHHGGETYRSNRVALGLKVSSSGRGAKVNKVNAHPPGSKAVCHVNPRAPWEAVLEPSSPSVLFPLLFPLPFLGGGLAVFFAMLRGVRRQKRRAVDPSRLMSALEPVDRAAPAAAAGPVVLKSGSQRMAKAGCLGFFALFWNGIVLAGVVHAGWFTLFMIPFILVGLGLLGFTGYLLLGTRNARVTLVLAGDPPAAGGKFRVDYRLDGRVHVLRNLRIVLAAYEVARYRRGTDTVTRRGQIWRIPVLDTSDPALFAQGGADLAIPLAAMPSFKARDNSIEWRFEVRAEIPDWPDIADDFDVTVLPATRVG
ncbi:MAG: DUF3592 domain-containing protein [Kiritimatiellia bacterium]